ncbi:MAG: PQQ-like beta-propeller repeat protein [Actinobacteria bacterium]|nr:PQQ-like beta-propeller repeat protein [Actinomycetota bacterium]
MTILAIGAAILAAASGLVIATGHHRPAVQLGTAHSSSPDTTDDVTSGTTDDGSSANLGAGDASVDSTTSTTLQATARSSTTSSTPTSSTTVGPVSVTSPQKAAPTEWPMFMGGPQHTGQSPAAGPQTSHVRWTYGDSNPPEARGAVVVGSDGTAYLAHGANGPCGPIPPGPSCVAQVDAVSSTGQRRWQWIVNDQVDRSVPAVDDAGNVYLTTDRGTGSLFAITPAGATRWTLSLNGHYLRGSVTIGTDGTLYVQDSNSTVFAVRAIDGHVLWERATNPGSIGYAGAPAVSPDGKTVYATSGGGLLYALNPGGAVKWSVPVSGPSNAVIANAPSVGPDGTIYVAAGGSSGDTPSDIDAFSPAGSIKWHFTSDGMFETTPAVTSGGLVVAANNMGTVVGLHAANGTVAWTYHSDGDYGANFYLASPVVGADGTVYAANQFGLVALKQGSVAWSAAGIPTGGATPALSRSGRLLVVRLGQLVAYG